MLIARVDFKEGLRKKKLRKVCQQLNLLKIIMSVFQCMNIPLQFLCTLCFSFPVHPQNLNLNDPSVCGVFLV